MSKKINIAVIGTGHLGNFHAEKYSKHSSCCLIGVVDNQPDRAKLIAKRYGTEGYTDFHKILDKVDAVSIAVPTQAHYDIAKTCLTGGVDVLIEKPITHHSWQAEELVTIAKKNNRILQVGHLERFNPAFERVSEIINNPLFIECHRLHSFVSRGTDVDVILDLMIHDLDIILHLVSSDVKKIDALGVSVLSSNIDIANVRLQFQNGCVANITSSRVSVNPLRKIRIFQPDCYASVDFHDSQINLYRKVQSEGEALSEIKLENISLGKKDILDEEIKAFVQSVMHRIPPKVSGEEALKALALAHDIVAVIKKTTKTYYPNYELSF